MSKNRFYFITIFAAAFVLALGAQAEMGIPIQLKLKSPSGVYPTESGLNFRVLVLSPVTNCVLREENFTNQSLNNGSVTLFLGSGTLGPVDAGLSLSQVYDNNVAKTNLSCVDANGNIATTGQTYTPAAGDFRNLRVTTSISSENILVNFTMRSVPYAIQAESVAGKSGADILVRNPSTQLNQANLEALLATSTNLAYLQNIASAGAASTAISFTGLMAGDVNGTQGATSVVRLKGIPISATAPTTGQVLQYNGTQYVPYTIPAAPVLSVSGHTGVVNLTTADVSGLGSAAIYNVGTAATNVVQLDGSGKIPTSTLPSSVATSSSPLGGDVSGTLSATIVNTVGGKTSLQVATSVNDTAAATSANTAGTIVKRDGSGNVIVNNVSSTSNSTNSLYLFDTTNSVRVKAPSGLSSNLVLVLPNSNGSSGQVLQTDGSGNLSWTTPVNSGGTVTSVTAASPLISSGGNTPQISLPQAASSASGYLSAADWSTFNGKQNALGFTPLDASQDLADLASVANARNNLGLGVAATLNVGTTAGTVAAGDDARITGALQSSAYAADVAPATACTSSQTVYWNTVSDTWACQNITYPASAVTSVAGRTGAVVLSSADISGLGSAAGLNAGNAAGEVVVRNASGDVTVSQLKANDVATDHIYLQSGANAVNLKASGSTTSSFVLTLPSDAGSAGQVLQTDGSGNLSWTTPVNSGGTVTSVTASAPLSSSGGATPNLTIAQATATTAGYLSASDFSSFNAKQNALGYTPLNPAQNLSDVASAATARANLGLGTAAVLNVGTSANQIPQLDAGGKILNGVLPSTVVTNSTSLSGDVSGVVGSTVVNSVGGKTSAQVSTTVNDTLAATSANTVSTIVKRSAAGDIFVAKVGATDVTMNNTFLSSGSFSVNLKAPVGLASNLVMTLPGNAGSAGQVLQTNGAGVLSWVTPATVSGGVTAVTASAPLSSSGGTNPNLTLAQASASTAGYLSSSDFSSFSAKQNALGYTPLNAASNLSDVASIATARTNLGLGVAATLNVGTVAGTVAAGDDARINGALQSSSYAADVAPAASCTSTQTPYWNTVADTWSCQNIAFPVSSVTSVAGRTGAVVLSSSDISGLGTVASLNVGVAANQIPQLDGSGKLPVSTMPTSVVTSVTASAPLISSGGATPNLTMAQASASAAGYLSSSDFSTFSAKQNALGFTPLNPASNLSDVASVATARTNLGLGGAAVLNVGTAASTVAAGNDSRITGALQASTFNGYVASAACTTLQSLYWNSVSSQFLCQNIAFPAAPVTTVAGRAGAVVLSSSDISGLGTAASLNVGTGSGNVVQLDGASRIPASTLPANALTTTSSHDGDVSGTVSALTVQKIQGVPVSATAPTAGQALVYNGTAWVPTTGFPSFRRTTADQSSNSTTATAVTNLSFPVAAGVTYKYKFNILYTSAATTTGLKLGLTYPAATIASGLANIASGADGTGAYFQGVLNTSGDVVTAANTPTTAVQYATVEGIIQPSAAGTLQLVAGSEIALSTVTIKAGSVLEITQIP